MIGNRKEIIKYLVQRTTDDEIFEIKEKKKTRSLNANNYLWELIGQISNITNKSKEEVYRSYIVDYGIYRTITVDTKALNTILKLWTDKGLGWLYSIVDNGEENTSVILYYGSSSYNSKQMSVLLDAVVQDCKEMNIPTLDDKEIERLELTYKSNS